MLGWKMKSTSLLIKKVLTLPQEHKKQCFYLTLLFFSLIQSHHTNGLLNHDVFFFFYVLNTTANLHSKAIYSSRDVSTQNSSSSQPLHGFTLTNPAGYWITS